MRKLYEDFFDDNAGQLQTSLKELTDEIDNPADDLLYKAQQSNVIIYPSMDAEQFGNILREYMKWPYIVDYEIPDEIEESPFVPHEKKDEEETPKTDETAEQQPETESTTDAGSEDSKSWTQKVSGFFKQLFNKK